MSANFSKEERVAFGDLLAGFDDAMVESRNVAKFGTQGELMERANDTIWRPVPYIVTSQDRVIGTPVSTQTVNQLTVPSRLNIQKNASWVLNAKQTRDMMQEGRLRDAAFQRLASDINTSVRNVASLQGTLVARVVGAAGDYDDIALAESIMNEQGVPMDDRHLFLNTRDYNGLAGNLAGRQNLVANKTISAYERSQVGMVAGFNTYKTDGVQRIAAVSATPTMATNGALVRYVPRTLDANGNNVDNRYQQITVSSTTGVTAGAAFTIAGIESVHQITKQATGQLKTYRVISVDSGTTMTISPPIISANSSPSDAELQYKNCEAVTTSGTANIVFLNAVATGANPFWHYESIELLPGRYNVPGDQGPNIIRGSTDQGIELVMTKFFDTSTYQTLYTVDTFYGVVNTNPEMNGLILFNQT